MQVCTQNATALPHPPHYKNKTLDAMKVLAITLLCIISTAAAQQERAEPEVDGAVLRETTDGTNEPTETNEPAVTATDEDDDRFFGSLTCRGLGRRCFADRPAVCCSGTCEDGFCVRPGDTPTASCTALGDACTLDNECCTGLCDDECVRCLDNGSAKDCDNNDDCCSSFCDDDGECAPAPAVCLVLDDPCTEDSECCTGNCNSDGSGLCEIVCQAVEEDCLDFNDCCTGICGIPEMGMTGVCLQCLDYDYDCDYNSECCSGFCDDDNSNGCSECIASGNTAGENTCDDYEDEPLNDFCCSQACVPGHCSDGSNCCCTPPAVTGLGLPNVNGCTSDDECCLTARCINTCLDGTSDCCGVTI